MSNGFTQGTMGFGSNSTGLMFSGIGDSDKKSKATSPATTASSTYSATEKCSIEQHNIIVVSVTINFVLIIVLFILYSCLRGERDLRSIPHENSTRSKEMK